MTATSTQQRLAFIGAGNMAQALVGGLLTKQWPANLITLSDIDTERLAALEQTLGVNTYADNTAALKDADIVVLAVKPQLMERVCRELAFDLDSRTLVISIAAGITTDSLSQWLNTERIVRVMPNTPALVQTGASGLYAMPVVSKTEKTSAQTILESAGLTLWFDDETMLDAVTAVSGSGPAYFFLMMQSMIAAAQKLGLSEDSARKLVLQTALGAATLAGQGEDGPATLKQKVTSPGGTTAAALDVFDKAHFEKIVEEALTAARDRSLELSGQ